jgi:hypothetical protein
MHRVRNMLPGLDRRDEVATQTCRFRDSARGDAGQGGEDLGREDVGVRLDARVFPIPRRTLAVPHGDLPADRGVRLLLLRGVTRLPEPRESSRPRRLQLLHVLRRVLSVAARAVVAVAGSVEFDAATSIRLGRPRHDGRSERRRRRGTGSGRRGIVNTARGNPKCSGPRSCRSWSGCRRARSL